MNPMKPRSGGNVLPVLDAGRRAMANGQFDAARRHFQQALAMQPDLAAAHAELGNLYRIQGLYDQAEQHFRQASTLAPENADFVYLLGNMLSMQGRSDEAYAAYTRVLALQPLHAEARWRAARVLPIIFQDNAEIDTSRANFARRLKELGADLKLGAKNAQQQAVRGAGSSTNFFLQYQGRDDLQLQQYYGGLLERVMAARYPHWAKPRPMPPAKPGEPVRVGYSSAFLRAHNGALWLQGWLRHRDREKFEIFCYHTGASCDEQTDRFRELCDHFVHVPDDLEACCRRIVTDNLHVLVYPELGMHASSMLMAALRLAPIQCVGWGHPITSGLSTMDYWLSCQLMEPDNGQTHYTERLIQLPNMGHSYSREKHDAIQQRPPARKRADFHLPDDAVVYLCSQSLFKYLPDYDHLIVDIAKRVGNAKFVFLAISSTWVVKKFMQRIDRAFGAAGLRAQDFCVMLPRQTEQDYVELNRLCDVFLDNPPWSGNNTTLTALDCHLPVVTWPTGLMRGRHSYAIMTMIGVTDTIADSAERYVQLAVRLGTDKAWRDEITASIIANLNKLYDDPSVGPALEAFYLRAIQQFPEPVTD